MKCLLDSVYLYMTYLFVICCVPRLKRDSLKSCLRHSIEFVLNRVNERFHESENETGCLVTLFDRVLCIPRASSLLRHVRDQNVPTYRFYFKLATQKCGDLLLPQIGKNMGGNRLSFGETMPRRTP